MDFTSRDAALGDSFTEGVGDDDPARPNGVRAWADRVAEQLDAGRSRARATPTSPSAAGRLPPDHGRTGGRRRRPQADAWSRIYAGGQRHPPARGWTSTPCWPDYDAGVRRLRLPPAPTVVLFTGFRLPSPRRSSARPAGRTAIYNELGPRRLPGTCTARNSGGLLAAAASSATGVTVGARPAAHVRRGPREHRQARPHRPGARPLDRRPAHDPGPGDCTRAEAIRANARWVREFAGPWVVRRVTGKSSGDGLTPRYPQLTRL